MAERAATYADLVLFDLALHSIRDNNGSTHGRSYMRFKATAPTQTVFSALKLCFDRTDEPWPLDDGDERELLPLNEGATFLARRSATARPTSSGASPGTRRDGRPRGHGRRPRPG
jgi:hypothetical protein